MSLIDQITDEISNVGNLYMEWGDQTQAKVVGIIRTAITGILIKEIGWCIAHPNNSEPAFEAGFLAGIRQAVLLITKEASPSAGMGPTTDLTMTWIPLNTLKRSPIKKRRSKPRPGRLKGEALERLRRECFERAGGLCQLRISLDCTVWSGWDFGHMHHEKHKSLGGKDESSNVLWACPTCHWLEHNPKPCPSKRLEGGPNG